MTEFPESYPDFLLSRLNGQVTEEEYHAVSSSLQDATRAVMNRVFNEPYQAPALVELYYRELVTFYTKDPTFDERTRLLLALRRDITPLLHAHIRERHRYEGNAVLEFAGSTGSGKSSAMLGLMERHNNLAKHVQAGGVSALRARLSIDLQDLPTKLSRLGPGDGVAMDEQLHLVGEGAETAMKNLRNMEDTLRGTMIDLYFASPGRRADHDASQGFMESLGASPVTLRAGKPGLKRTRFLFSMGMAGRPALPLGTVDLDWASPTVFEAYSHLKRENLERTKRGVFHSTAGANLDAIQRVFENPQFIERLRAKNGKMSAADWRRALKWYAPSMSNAERDMTIGEIEDMLQVLQESPHRFPRIWNMEPPAMLRLLALGEITSDDGPTTEQDA